MAATKHATLDSTLAQSELFGVLTHVVQQDTYEIAGLSNELHEMVFISGRTLTSWGSAFIASVQPQGSGSVLQLTVARLPAAPQALMDGRKNQKAADKLIESLETALAAPTPPVGTPVESFALVDGETVPWTSGEFPGG